MKSIAAALLLLFCLSSHAADDQPAYGLFGQLHVTRPTQPNGATVLLLSDREGWTARQDALSTALAGQGAHVVGIDMAYYLAKLESIGDRCSYPAGHVEELAHWMARHEGQADYSAPLLIGDGAGAVFAYAIATQAPSGTFSGLMTLGWDYAWRLPKPICAGDAGAMTQTDGDRGFRVVPVATMPLSWSPQPWLAQTRNDSVIDPYLMVLAPLLSGVWPASKTMTADAELAQRYAADWTQAKTALSSLPDDIADLPLTEVAPVTTDRQRIVLLLTGDGGWAGLDKGIAEAMANEGLRVVGFSTLKFFWTPRTPEQSAAAVARVLAHYGRQYPDASFVVAGYSFGASLVPLMVNRLPAELAARTVAGVMISPDPDAVFEIKVGDWFGGGQHDGSLPVKPEIAKSPIPITCIHGADEDDSFCPAFTAARFQTRSLPGGHHYDGDYDALGRVILDVLPKS